jgi:membrane peptidoglycan carboxypeptidase
MVFPTVIEQKVSNLYAGTRGYLLQEVRAELMARGGMTEAEIDAGGLTILTTIDRNWQRAAVKAVKDLPEDRPKGLHVAVATVDPATGAIRAMYGGADYMKRQQNAVTQDIAQAGSTFKPIALAAALEDGHELSEGYSGQSPMKIHDWEVENIGNTSYGWMSLLRATENSVNTVYAQLNNEIGGGTTRQAAVALGLPEDTVGLDSDLTNVLGTASPHPIDMARVYATFASGGVRRDTYIVEAAADPSRTLVYQGKTKGKRVYSKETMAELTYALTQVVEAGTGAKAQELERPAAAKTGTSEEHRSAWFVGYTPQLATVVAFYQEGKKGKVVELTPFAGLPEINGGALPAQVWVDLMRAEHEGFAVVDFPERPDAAGSGDWEGPAETGGSWDDDSDSDGGDSDGRGEDQDDDESITSDSEDSEDSEDDEDDGGRPAPTRGPTKAPAAPVIPTQAPTQAPAPPPATPAPPTQNPTPPPADSTEGAAPPP